MIILLNYANRYYRQSQKLNTKSAIKFGQVDKVISMTPKDIDSEFYEKNKHILSKDIGAGYWLWKPYIISKVLNTISLNDVLVYSDSGIEFTDSLRPLISLLDKSKQDVISFHLKDTVMFEERWTKRDTFILMECEDEIYKKTPQIGSSLIIFRKTKKSLDFVDQWLTYCQNENILTDKPNLWNIDDDKSFIEHRHDQSVFSLLYKKNKYISYREPSQYGINERKKHNNSNYGQITNHHRRRTRSWKNRIKRYSGWFYIKRYLFDK